MTSVSFDPSLLTHLSSRRQYVGKWSHRVYDYYDLRSQQHAVALGHAREKKLRDIETVAEVDSRLPSELVERHDDHYHGRITGHDYADLATAIAAESEARDSWIARLAGNDAQRHGLASMAPSLIGAMPR